MPIEGEGRWNDVGLVEDAVQPEDGWGDGYSRSGEVEGKGRGVVARQEDE